MNRAVQQLDQVIQENASIAEETAATAQGLSQQVETLQSTAEFFHVTETVQKPENSPSSLVEMLQGLSDEEIRSAMTLIVQIKTRSEETSGSNETDGSAVDETVPSKNETAEALQSPRSRPEKDDMKGHLLRKQQEESGDDIDQEFERY